MIIAIDGPAGSGKSSTAREVARRLGFNHLESGAFYRALTWAALRAGLKPADWPDLGAEELDTLDVRAVPGEHGMEFYAGGEAIGEAIRSPEVNAWVSTMAAVPTVREWLLGRLREVARGTDLVSEGRDVGTVVFPDADLKVFLTADPAVRARRRLADHGVADPTPDEVAAETERLLERDRMDTQREVAPLRRADDAVLIDTTDLDFDAQVDVIVRLARERGAASDRD